MINGRDDNAQLALAIKMKKQLCCFLLKAVSGRDLNKKSSSQLLFSFVKCKVPVNKA